MFHRQCTLMFIAACCLSGVSCAVHNSDDSFSDGSIHTVSSRRTEVLKPRSEVVSFASRDAFMTTYERPPLHSNDDAYYFLNSYFYNFVGWYPWGYTVTRKAIDQNGWIKNKQFYSEIASIRANDEPCLSNDVRQCIRNLSQTYVVSTKAGDDEDYSGSASTDVNGRRIARSGHIGVFANTPDDQGRFINAHFDYDQNSKAVQSIKLSSTFINALWFTSTDEQFRRTGLFKMVKALQGGSFCDEHSFYLFLYNSLVKNPKRVGNEFGAHGGTISRRSEANYSPRIFCGLQFTYSTYEGETASSTDSGSFSGAIFEIRKPGRI